MKPQVDEQRFGSFTKIGTDKRDSCANARKFQNFLYCSTRSTKQVGRHNKTYNSEQEQLNATQRRENPYLSTTEQVLRSPGCKHSSHTTPAQLMCLRRKGKGKGKSKGGKGHSKGKTQRRNEGQGYKRYTPQSVPAIRSRDITRTKEKETAKQHHHGSHSSGKETKDKEKKHDATNPASSTSGPPIHRFGQKWLYQRLFGQSWACLCFERILGHEVWAQSQPILMAILGRPDVVLGPPLVAKHPKRPRLPFEKHGKGRALVRKSPLAKAIGLTRVT